MFRGATSQVIFEITGSNDESNPKSYGSMLKQLASWSELPTVTPGVVKDLSIHLNGDPFIGDSPSLI